MCVAHGYLLKTELAVTITHGLQALETDDPSFNPSDITATAFVFQLSSHRRNPGKAVKVKQTQIMILWHVMRPNSEKCV